MANLGFIVSANCSPQDAPKSVPHVSSRRAHDWSLAWQSLGRTAVVAVMSTALMVPGTVSALETPLVFDHDQSLVGANFSNRSDLRGAIFSKSNCKSASFEASDLTNAQLDDANVSRTTSESVHVPPKYIIQMHLCDFHSANAQDSTFRETNMSKMCYRLRDSSKRQTFRVRLL